jgi:hypothetical protein
LFDQKKKKGIIQASMSSEQYWRNQLAQTEAEYEQIIQGLRDEVEKQRRRCSELMHEHAMQRATAAADVRDFCVQYVAGARQHAASQHRSSASSSNLSTAAAASVTPSSSSSALAAFSRHISNNNQGESIPLPVLLGFLHEYSHGLLQLPENHRKRKRPDSTLSPLHHRLRQRMLARHRLNGREDHVLDENNGSGVEGQLLSPAGSPCSPPSGPLTGGPRCANAAAGPSAFQSSVFATTTSTTSTAAAAVVPPSGSRTSIDGAESVGRRSGGGGGPVLAASVFGLPTLPPR